MRVLWLTPELPFYPGGSGGSTRQFQLLRRLVQRGWDADCVAPVHRDQREGAERLRAAGVELIGAPRPASRPREALEAIGRRPVLAGRIAAEPLLAWQVDVFWTALRPLAERAIAERRPDVLLVEHDWAAGWSRELGAGPPRALALENLTWEYYEARADAAGGAARAALRLEARRWLRFDRERLRDHDLLLAMSEPDRDAVGAVCDVPCGVVPNGVDTSAMVLPPPPDAPVLLFTGSLGYPPNAEALLWLLREIWPQIRREVPEARLLVVGRDAPPEAERLADDHVTLAGFVPEIADWFARAAVVLVPILSGGGTRLKVLDGLASGRPVVSTTAGAFGVAARDGEHIAIADGAEAFARRTVALLRDPGERRRLGAGGRRLAEERYDWSAIGDELDRLLTDLAASRS